MEAAQGARPACAGGRQRTGLVQSWLAPWGSTSCLALLTRQRQHTTLTPPPPRPSPLRPRPQNAYASSGYKAPGNTQVTDSYDGNWGSLSEIYGKGSKTLLVRVSGWAQCMAGGGGGGPCWFMHGAATRASGGVGAAVL